MCKRNGETQTVPLFTGTVNLKTWTLNLKHPASLWYNFNANFPSCPPIRFSVTHNMASKNMHSFLLRETHSIAVAVTDKGEKQMPGALVHGRSMDKGGLTRV